ncbi:MAG: sulfite exporter TauE/SafE family protein [Solobacterium sp.]|nr:sulfite exporter TauE/SafE family protein [Solobacterium sp.]
MNQIWLFILVGFLAQMIDGTLGMAYGVSGRTFLKTFLGLPSSLASAIIHVAEVPTTLVSGVSHLLLKNVDKDKLLKLAIPGIIGGAIGAWFLSDFGTYLEPFINVYLILMGIRILIKAIQPKILTKEMGKSIYVLGFVGAFFDACGGGGWGPIVTSTMMARGSDAKKTIGTVNTAEFLVTVAETTSFVLLIENLHLYASMIVSMIIGGVIAAPIATYLCKKLPTKPLMIAVGILIIVLNIYSLVS